MPYTAPARDQYDIDHIYGIVRRLAQNYHVKRRSLLREQRKNHFDYDIYNSILRDIRMDIFTDLHAGLRSEFSAAKTTRWFKHLCKLIVNERSHSFQPGNPLPNRVIIGIVEGLWDMINTETHFGEFNSINPHGSS